MAEERAQAVTLAAEQERVIRERRERIAAHKRAVAARNLDQETLEERPTSAPLNLLAEGDSWFDYPLFRDTIGWIKAAGKPVPEILSLAHHGDAAVDMLGVAQRQRIIENLRDRRNGAFDALLFSGGGNDIAGDRFCLWVLKFVAGSDPAHGVDRQRLAEWKRGLPFRSVAQAFFGLAGLDQAFGGCSGGQGGIAVVRQTAGSARATISKRCLCADPGDTFR